MTLTESIEAKHAAFLGGLRHDDVAPLFRSFAIPTPAIKHHLVATENLKKEHLNKGYRGYISYSLRSATLPDAAISDDRIVIVFDARKIDYGALVGACFDELVRAFGAYIGEIYSDPFVEFEFDKIRKVNSRYGVYRVRPVSYYSQTLCKSAFSLTPEEVVAKLAGEVEEARIFNDGVKIIVTSKFVPFEELELRTRVVTELLKGRPMDQSQ